MLSILMIAAISTAVLGNSKRLGGTESERSSGDEKQKNQQHADLRLTHADVPMYPQMARLARVSGVVEVQVTVNNGAVTNTEVKSGAGVLAQATEENVKSWRFAQSANTTFVTKFTYKLDEKKPLYGQNPRVELDLPFRATITSAPVLGD